MSGIARIITGKPSSEQRQALEMQKASTAKQEQALAKQTADLKARESEAAMREQSMRKARARGGRRDLLSAQRASAELGVQQDTLGA